MKNRSDQYWLDRSEAQKRYLESLWPVASRQMAKEYAALARQMQGRILAFYGKFGVADDKGNIVVSFADAVKPMNQAEAIAFKNAVTAAKKKYKGTPDKAFYEILDQYGKTAALPRFLMLELEAQRLAHDAAVMQTRVLAQTLAKNTATAYYYTINQIETALGVGLKYGAMNATRVRAIMLENWSGKTFLGRVFDDKMANDLKRVMLDGFVKGKRSEQMTKIVAERFEVSNSAAERLVRTESAHVVEQATLAGYTESGVEKYEYSAVLDTRTSEICEALDGKVFPLSDAQPGVNYPPMHPNCRSTTFPVYDNEKIEVASAERPYNSWAEWKAAEGSEKIDKVARQAAEPIVRIV